MNNFKLNPNRGMYYCIKIKSGAGAACAASCTNLLSDTGVKVILLLGRHSRQLHKGYESAVMVCSQAECVFILECCFASKFVFVCHEEFSYGHP
jgi:hypothetical protein